MRTKYQVQQKVLLLQNDQERRRQTQRNWQRKQQVCHVLILTSSCHGYISCCFSNELSSFVTVGVGSKSRSQQSLKESKAELDKGINLFIHKIHFYVYFFVDKKHYIFGQRNR